MSTAPSFDFEKLGHSSTPKPLVVDLDGTLVRSDLVVESAFAISDAIHGVWAAFSQR